MWKTTSLERAQGPVFHCSLLPSWRPFRRSKTERRKLGIFGDIRPPLTPEAIFIVDPGGDKNGASQIWAGGSEKPLAEAG
jgi:hypothetical protein